MTPKEFEDMVAKEAETADVVVQVQGGVATIVKKNTGIRLLYVDWDEANETGHTDGVETYDRDMLIGVDKIDSYEKPVLSEDGKVIL